MNRPEDGEQGERWRAARRKALAYQGATEAVFAILIATGLGYWADLHCATAPRYLLIGVAIGFASFVLRLLRLGRQLNEVSEHRDDRSEEAP
ncbi:MAG: AtpZ/AtpI family protein [Myxococcales bacterium]|nr:AtpZ/AtpI family protein [Myxococcales bacterium]